MTRLKVVLILYDHQHYTFTINDNFTHLPEVYRNSIVNIGLYLSGAPFGLVRMPHECAWFQECIDIGHFFPLTLGGHIMHPDLAALVGSRICHDLISPIGAIGNGVELLALTDGDTDAEMELISESVQNASARIRYFRIAYGAATEEQMVSRTEILSILAATARGGRINYIWQIEGDQQRRIVRCALLMLQALESSLPLGGDVQVYLDADNWVMRAEGPRYAVDQELWDNLLSPQVGFHHTAAQVQFALLPSVLAEAGRRLQFKQSQDRLLVRF